LALSPKTAFSDRIFTVSGRLDLDEIQGFIDTLERETGVQRGQYSLSIVNDIRVSGTLDGIAFEEQFNPTVNFEINALEVQLSQATESEGGALQPSSSSVLSRQSLEENSLGIFGMDLSVYLARRISLGVGIPATVGLLFLLFHVYRNTEKSELERLRLWHGHILVETRDVRILETQQYSNLANLEALITLAEQDQRIILHLPDQEKHHFFVQTPEQLYHYEADENKSAQNMIDVHRQPKRQRVWRLPRFNRNTNMSLAYEHALKGWAKAVDRKLYKEGEADYLAEMAYKLAKRMNVRGSELENIRMAAYLHKIGLMDVPDEVLQKKKKLTEKELELIRNHPSYARKQLDGAELLRPIAEIVYYQHERWDGSGYPEGLKGEEIPLGSRIISIANIWRSLQQKRPHRDAWTEDDAKKYLNEQSGKQFDPHIVGVFLADIDVGVGDIEIFTEEDRDV